MAGVAAKFVTKKLLNIETEKYKHKKVASGHDPYFALIDDPKRPGRTKKVKKQIPDYIPEHDALILAKVRKRAYRLDVAFNFFFLRFGVSSVVGLIPGVGDIADALLALMLIRECQKIECGLGDKEKWMYGNLALDFITGLVPFLGDIADAVFRCNTKNLKLLEERLDEVYKPKEVRERQRRQTGGRGRAPDPATVYEDISDDERLQANSRPRA